MSTTTSRTPRAELIAFRDAALKEGRITPAMASHMVEFMEAIDARKTVLSFTEAGERKTMTTEAWYCKFISLIPKDATAFYEFAAPDGFTLAPGALEELASARRYASKHGCSLLQAVSAMSFAEGTTDANGAYIPAEQAGEAFMKRAKVHAEKCGISLVEAAAHLDDPQLVGLDEWRAAVQGYAAKHKCGLDEARIAVPMTGF